MEKYRFPENEQSILESMKIPFAVYQFINDKVVTIALSEGFCELFGYDDIKTAVYEMDHNMYINTHPDDVAVIEDAAVRFALEDGKYDVVYRSKKVRGTEYHLIHSFGRHVVRDGTRLAYVWYTDEGLYTQNQEIKDLRSALHGSIALGCSTIRSRYDYLTGLPNMSYFFELTGKKSVRCQKEGRVPVMMFMDLCGLKYFNHVNGFSEGDDLLRAFSMLLIETFGSENCCHIGQDHFAVYSEYEGIEERLKEFFENCKTINNCKSIPVRVGVYFDNCNQLVEASIACDRAKIACDTLKGAYASVYCFYNHEQRDNLIKKQFILTKFDEALSKKYIKVFYQPIVRTINGRVCDEEALARWDDPETGLMPPMDFIPYLEESRLIYKLDLYVLESVLETINRKKKIGLTIVPASINISRSDFDVCDIVEEIRKRVDAAGVERNLITIEVTETTMSIDTDFMKDQIERFMKLGFNVWLDDFGTGYSSLEVLRDINFNLVKFDMSFLRDIETRDHAKVILTELIKMVTSIGMETVCEGVETQDQLVFLREIGCSKLQGYYFCKPIPFETVLERYRQGIQIGFENPAESPYYEAMGSINLNDISFIASEGGNQLSGFNSLPMGIIEVRGDTARFVSNNRSYREFVKDYLGYDLSYEGSEFAKFSDSFMNNVVKNCCEKDLKTFYDETMPSGVIIHSFARRIAVNPVNGDIAVAVAVLSITEPDEGTTYANIARALAADYYNIYYVDLTTDKFIEYTSPVGKDELAMERHGEDFFNECIKAADRIFEEDRAAFFAVFSKEKVVKELDEQGVFTTTYRIVDTGAPTYVNMKITKMQPNSDKIIIGISIVDAQMKQKEMIDSMKKEHDAFTRIMALSDRYLSLYSIDLDTGKYVEHSATKEYNNLELEKHGEDFFGVAHRNAQKAIYKEDYDRFVNSFTKENVLKEIQENGIYSIHYRLMINGEPQPVSLRVARFMENDREKLIAGVRVPQKN